MTCRFAAVGTCVLHTRGVVSDYAKEGSMRRGLWALTFGLTMNALAGQSNEDPSKNSQRGEESASATTDESGGGSPSREQDPLHKSHASSTSTEGLKIIPSPVPNGGTMVRLKGRIRNTVVVARDDQVPRLRPAGVRLRPRRGAAPP